VTDAPRAKLLGMLAIVAVVGAMALGMGLRAADPLGNPVLAAEDPYTHLTLTKEHLRDGNLQPLHEGGALYPPGMHAVLGAFWSYSGADMLDLVRFLPVLFGGISILAVAFLVGRWEGALAAVLAALAIAILPEAIARTSFATPTALAVAVLPFAVAATLEVLRGKLHWLAAAAPLSLLLVLAHPWTMVVFGVAGGLFLLLYLAFPWQAAAPPTRRGFAVALALLSSCTGLALLTQWSVRGSGFEDLTTPFLGGRAGLALGALLGGAFVLGLALAFAWRNAGSAPLLARTARPRWGRMGGCALLGVLVVGVSALALSRGLPNLVDPATMVGWPILLAAMVALLALPFRSTPAAHAGAALFLVAFPLTMIDFWHSPWWPQRMAVFMGLGAAILVGAAAARLVPMATWVLSLEERPSARDEPETATAAPRRVRPVVPVALVGLILTAAIAAGSPSPYPPWYRLYDGCQADALRGVGELMDQPEDLVATGAWQSQLVIGAFAPDATRVWYKPALFRDEDERGTFAKDVAASGGDGYVVVDPYLANLTDADPSFLGAAPYEPAGTWCPDAEGAPTIALFRVAPSGAA
jgi:hypothetical protein